MVKTLFLQFVNWFVCLFNVKNTRHVRRVISLLKETTIISESAIYALVQVAKYDPRLRAVYAAEARRVLSSVLSTLVNVNEHVAMYSLTKGQKATIDKCEKRLRQGLSLLKETFGDDIATSHLLQLQQDSE